MTDPIDLEIGLSWRGDDAFDVSLEYSNPVNENDARVLTGPLFLDREGLTGLATDDDAYSQLLSESLFGLTDVASWFEEAEAVADSASVPLRLRLRIDPRAPSDLHALRWEMLRKPSGGSPVVIAENVRFSRYLSSADWPPILVRPKRELSALVAVANPADMSPFGARALIPIDVQRELAVAQAALGVGPVTSLTSGGDVTVENITAALEQGVHDVLYLVCHSALQGSETRLILENSQGGIAKVSGAELVEALRQLDHRQRPALVVLGGCQSAGGDGASSLDHGALAALGPRLAGAGVAAVVAMQSNITMQTVARFMSPFFQELNRDGVVDRAMAAARYAIRDRPDWWAPVLFMRVRSGRIWNLVGSQPTRQLRAFLCHSSSDKPAVRKLYMSLRKDDISPWLDEEDLLAGQDWQVEIRNAIRASHVVLVCLSKGSINKVGYVQKEIRDVLDRADEQPEGTIFVIPVRLEPCEVPERINRWHWVDLFENGGYAQLMRALRRRADDLLAK